MPILIRPFAYSSNVDREQWQLLVDGFDKMLRLRRHEPGTLTRLAAHLYGRAGGSISSLSMMIRSAAITAILDGTEDITKQSLDAVALDHAATTSAVAVNGGRKKHPAVNDGAA